MELSDINTGKICPYCGGETEYKDSSIIYKKSYGMIYICQPCQAWVGVHKGTDNALGRLANNILRQWKQQAHKYFDPLWKAKINNTGCSKKEARDAGYKWISEEMGFPMELCHIGMFDVHECQELVDLCKPYYKKL